MNICFRRSARTCYSTVYFKHIFFICCRINCYRYNRFCSNSIRVSISNIQNYFGFYWFLTAGRSRNNNLCSVFTYYSIFRLRCPAKFITVWSRREHNLCARSFRNFNVSCFSNAVYRFIILSCP